MTNDRKELRPARTPPPGLDLRQRFPRDRSSSECRRWTLLRGRHGCGVRSAWFIGVLVLMVYLIFAIALYPLPPQAQ